METRRKRAPKTLLDLNDGLLLEILEGSLECGRETFFSLSNSCQRLRSIHDDDFMEMGLARWYNKIQARSRLLCRWLEGLCKACKKTWETGLVSIDRERSSKSDALLASFNQPGVLGFVSTPLTTKLENFLDDCQFFTETSVSFTRTDVYKGLLSEGPQEHEEPWVELTSRMLDWMNKVEGNESFLISMLLDLKEGFSYNPWGSIDYLEGLHRGLEIYFSETTLSLERLMNTHTMYCTTIAECLLVSGQVDQTTAILLLRRGVGEFGLPPLFGLMNSLHNLHMFGCLKGDEDAHKDIVRMRIIFDLQRENARINRHPERTMLRAGHDPWEPLLTKEQRKNELVTNKVVAWLRRHFYEVSVFKGAEKLWKAMATDPIRLARMFDTGFLGWQAFLWPEFCARWDWFVEANRKRKSLRCDCGDGYDPLQLCISERSKRESFLWDSVLEPNQIFLYYLVKALNQSTPSGMMYECGMEKLVLFEGLVCDWKAPIHPFGISITDLIHYFLSKWKTLLNDTRQRFDGTGNEHRWFLEGLEEACKEFDGKSKNPSLVYKTVQFLNGRQAITKWKPPTDAENECVVC